MPSKKSVKAVKKPANAPGNKRKAARPAKKAAPKMTRVKAAAKAVKHVAKAAVKRIKVAVRPVLKPVAVKPARARTVALAPPPPPVAHRTPALPLRPMPKPLMGARADEETDAELPAAASLLAGPRNVKPYIARRGEQYMNKEQLGHFAQILNNWKRDLMVEVDRTVLHMKDEAANFPDPNDRATQEDEFSLELRTRDRERKLIRKIDEALKRIEDGNYGYCLETGEEIGIKRLEARPVATLSVEAQERRERREKQYGDRDDRYR
jgi:DnaK suppressor protein